MESLIFEGGGVKGIAYCGAIKFLEEGSKVKAYVFFKGRSILFKEQGEILLLKFAQELAEHGKVEQLPLLEGKKMLILVAPKKK